MDKQRLAVLVQDEIRKRGISEREAGRQAGVAHTTISRIVEQKQVSTDTLLKVATWLKINANDLMAVSDIETEEGVAAAISVIVQAEPRLAEAFRMTAEMILRGELDPTAAREILSYVSWRLGHEAGSIGKENERKSPEEKGQ